MRTLLRLLVSVLATLALVLPLTLASTPAHAVRKPPAKVGRVLDVSAGLGRLDLGLGPAKVKRLLGQPDRAVRVRLEPGKPKRLIRFEYHRKYGLSVSFTLRGRQKAQIISLRHRQFRTEERIRKGAGVGAVLAAYPDATCATISGATDRMCRITRGTRQTHFILNSRERVRRIDFSPAR